MAVLTVEQHKDSLAQDDRATLKRLLRGTHGACNSGYDRGCRAFEIVKAVFYAPTPAVSVASASPGSPQVPDCANCNGDLMCRMKCGAAGIKTGEDTAAAEKVAEKRRQIENQAPAVQGATASCNANPADCKVKCDGGDGPSCFAWGTRLWHAAPPKLADARVAMSKGCDSGTVVACAAAPQIDADIQAQNEQMEEAWGAVQNTADEIARQMWLVEWARKNHRQPEEVLQRVTRKIAEVTHTQLCPAKAAFIAQTSSAEYTKRAVSHCKDNPPVGSAAGNYYAGAETGQVVLTIQCQTVLASSCPNQAPSGPASPSASPGTRTVRTLCPNGESAKPAKAGCWCGDLSGPLDKWHQAPFPSDPSCQPTYPTADGPYCIFTCR